MAYLKVLCIALCAVAITCSPVSEAEPQPIPKPDADAQQFPSVPPHPNAIQGPAPRPKLVSAGSLGLRGARPKVPDVIDTAFPDPLPVGGSKFLQGTATNGHSFGFQSQTPRSRFEAHPTATIFVSGGPGVSFNELPDRQIPGFGLMPFGGFPSTPAPGFRPTFGPTMAPTFGPTFGPTLAPNFRPTFAPNVPDMHQFQNFPSAFAEQSNIPFPIQPNRPMSFGGQFFGMGGGRPGIFSGQDLQSLQLAGLGNLPGMSFGAIGPGNMPVGGFNEGFGGFGGFGSTIPPFGSNGVITTLRPAIFPPIVSEAPPFPLAFGGGHQFTTTALPTVFPPTGNQLFRPTLRPTLPPTFSTPRPGFRPTSPPLFTSTRPVLQQGFPMGELGIGATGPGFSTPRPGFQPIFPIEEPGFGIPIQSFTTPAPNFITTRPSFPISEPSITFLGEPGLQPGFPISGGFTTPRPNFIGSTTFSPFGMPGPTIRPNFFPGGSRPPVQFSTPPFASTPAPFIPHSPPPFLTPTSSIEGIPLFPSTFRPRPPGGLLAPLAPGPPLDGNGIYEYGYEVKAPQTGDLHGAWEKKGLDGVVRGQYHLLQPDGQVRVVTYTADEFNGFQADVQYLKKK